MFVGGAVFLWVLGNAVPGHTACRPVALLEGPAAIMNPTVALLRSHGIDSTSSRCEAERVVRASFTPGAGSSGYALRIRDEYGRTSDRVVRDAETAAALIETWASNEDADLVSPLVHAAINRGPGTVVRRIEELRNPSWLFSTAFDVAFGTDGSRWYGGAVTICATLHGLCVGGRGRMAHDDGESGTAAELDQVQTSGELLAVVSRPLLLRRFSLFPSWGSALPGQGCRPSHRQIWILPPDMPCGSKRRLPAAWPFLGAGR